jgi:hypothetical protein
LLRAATTGPLRELTILALIEYMLGGMPAVYADLEGYDMAARHFGIVRGDIIEALTGLNRMLSWLERISKYAARHYSFVVFSDQGQCQ